MDKERPELSRNQSLVLDILTRAGEPLTAYSLLDLSRADGLRAPVQIYRALEPLIACGLVHRLESLNAYIACNHPKAHRGTTVFTICTQCGDVGEYTDETVKTRLSDRAEEERFSVTSAMVEMRGLCGDCAGMEAPR